MKDIIKNLRPGDTVIIKEQIQESADKGPTIVDKKFTYITQYRNFKYFEDSRGIGRCFSDWDLEQRQIRMCK